MCTLEPPIDMKVDQLSLCVGGGWGRGGGLYFANHL